VIGRVIDIQCNPKKAPRPAECTITSKGLYFDWDQDTIDVSLIKKIFVNVNRTHYSDGTTETSAALIIDTKVPGPDSRYEYSDYSMLTSVEAQAAAGAKLESFVKQPTQPVSARFGEHYSAILGGLMLAGVLVALSLGRGVKRLEIDRDPNIRNFKASTKGLGPLGFGGDWETIDLANLVDIRYDAGAQKCVAIYASGEQKGFPTFRFSEKESPEAVQKIKAFVGLA
jgi:hypothetical protein